MSNPEERVRDSGDLARPQSLPTPEVQETIARLTREYYAEVVQHPGEMTPDEEAEVNRRLLQHIAAQPELLYAMTHAHLPAAGGELGEAGAFEYDPEAGGFRRRVTTVPHGEPPRTERFL